MYPDWSHFDHPPMVGLAIQLFTLNLKLHTELFIRLAAVIFGSINTYLIYLIGKQVKNELTGFYAALLFTASIYCSIISGTFILPDSPQVLFWLLSLLFLLKSLPDSELSRKSRNNLLIAGVMIGLALLSKYQSAFLWIGTILYIILYNRKWLKTKELYLSAFISLILFIPVIYWNYNNNLSSLAYHGSRVEIFNSGFNPRFFISELAGEIFYNNPVNFILICLGVISIIKHSKLSIQHSDKLLLCISIPLIIIVLLMSLFVSTLPHWTGPAYTTLLIIAASWLSERKSLKLVPISALFSLLLTFIIIVLGLLQINYGIFNLGSKDVSLELYGWKQMQIKFSKVVDKYRKNGLIDPELPMVALKWFSAAHQDYYLAEPLRKDLIAFGSLSDIHKYEWINKKRKALSKGDDALFIDLKLSTDVKNPDSSLAVLKVFHQSLQMSNDLWNNLNSKFHMVVPLEMIEIYRGKKIVKYAFVYLLKDYSGDKLNKE